MTEYIVVTLAVVGIELFWVGLQLDRAIRALQRPVVKTIVDEDTLKWVCSVNHGVARCADALEAMQQQVRLPVEPGGYSIPIALVRKHETASDAVKRILQEAEAAARP